MKRNDDIERILAQWLTEGPRHMSDRLFDGTLDRIDRLPRGRLADLQSRLPAMTLNVRLAAAAAFLVAILGAGLVVMNGVPRVGSKPSPTPSASIRPAIASDLQAAWLSATPRSVPGGSAERTYQLLLDRETLVLGQTNTEMTSVWSIDRPGHLQVRLLSSTVGYWSCAPGAKGSYDIAISADGNALIVTPQVEACLMQADVLTGTWRRTDGGVLTPGLSAAQVFRPFGPATAGRLWHSMQPITESEGNIQFANPGAPNGPGIIMAAAELDATDAACGTDPAGVEHSPLGIATWLATFPSLVVSPPQPVAIGGLNGLSVDISRSSDTSVRCGTTFGIWTLGSVLLKVHSGDMDRVILLDRLDGQTIAISVSTSGPTWDAVARAMPIIESFEFTR